MRAILRSKKSTNDEGLRARMPGVALEGQAPSVFMWMPGGVHTVTPFDAITGRPHKITVRVDRETAAALQAGLESKLQASVHRPYFDFEHDEAEASAWPKRFFWQDSPAPGVYVEVEWTARGMEAVSGKSYRAFSPAFHAVPKFGTEQKPARIVGAPFVMGGLVNIPAFEKISPLWARNAAGATPSSENNNNTKHMTKEELASLQAKRTALEEQIATLRAGTQNADQLKQIEDAEAEMAGIELQIENAELKAKNAEHEQKEAARRETQAEAAVQDAVRRGAIATKDTTLQAKWKKQIIADPEAIVLLAALPGHPALSGRRVTVPSRQSFVPGAGGSRIELMVEDLGTVLRAYGGQPNHQERGKLYAKELRGRMNEEDECMGVLQAATNTLGTVSGTLIVQKALDLLKVHFPVISRISTNLTDRVIGPKYDEAIKTTLVTVPTVGTYHTANGYVSQDVTNTDVSVTPNAHKFVQHEFNANEIASSRRNLFGTQEEAMHYAIGLDLVDAIYALFTTANYTQTPTTIPLVNFARTGVIAVGTAMGQAGRNANMGTRTLILNPDYYGKLSEDTVVVSNLQNQGAGDAIGSGVLPIVHGFLPVEASNLPSTGNMTGFGMRADAVALAAGVPINYADAVAGIPSTALQMYVTNPDTGLTVQFTAFVDHQLGKSYMRVAWIRGQAVGNLKSGQILRSGA